MAWTIKLDEKAERELGKLGAVTARRVVDYLNRRVAVSDDPRTLGMALSGPLVGYWRYRVGDYRLVCQIKDTELVVLVVKIAHRSGVYR